MASDDDDWPRDVILDLIMHLTRARYAKSAEHLADSLMVFETERAARQVATEKAVPTTPPVLKVISGGNG